MKYTIGLPRVIINAIREKIQHDFCGAGKCDSVSFKGQRKKMLEMLKYMISLNVNDKDDTWFCYTSLGEPLAVSSVG